ncbi:hypothetical protein DB32_000134 [Sandaracinus amylolyticus]|uniref:Uncharacterized protein n=1 Tax=Sandaracinus amylolyticus TaxID=927083 RepID=A0A0F6VYP9_9BACT|nr:hypothetical protein DB32_000134 [Sandaracinus amylolyticus]
MRRSMSGRPHSRRRATANSRSFLRGRRTLAASGRDVPRHGRCAPPRVLARSPRSRRGVAPTTRCSRARRHGRGARPRGRSRSTHTAIRVAATARTRSWRRATPRAS